MKLLHETAADRSGHYTGWDHNNQYDHGNKK